MLVLVSSLVSAPYKDEVFIIKGETDSNNYDKATIIVEGKNSSYYKTYSEDLDNNDFEIAVFFPKSGTYNLGVIPGDSGKTKAEEININSLDIY